MTHLPPWLLYVLLGTIIVAGISLAPIVGWAKTSSTGMWVLVVMFLAVFAFCAGVRIATGRWPGD